MSRLKNIVLQSTITGFILFYFLFIPNEDISIKILLYVIGFILYQIAIQTISNYRIKAIEVKGKDEQAKRACFYNEIQVASSQVSAVAEQLYVTLDENNEFSQQLFFQTHSMTELNRLVNEKVKEAVIEVEGITELLEDVKDTSVEMEGKSRISEDIISTSLKEILAIVNTVNEIQQSSIQTMNNVKRLDNKSKQISYILETVRNISKQTHLLALNATIEAARAGEAGRGFGVVAEEITKLSTETNKSVSDINQLIQEIQAEIGNVTLTMEVNANSVQKGVEVSNTIEKNLKKIGLSFEDVVLLIKKISELSQRQVEVTLNIEGTIDSIASIIQMAEGSVREVYTSVQKQKDNFEEIAQMSMQLNEASKNLFGAFGDQEAVQVNEQSTQMKCFLMEVTEVIISEIEEKQALISMDKSTHKSFLEGVLERYSFIEAIWTNDKKGRFICSIPDAGIMNASVREWFSKSIKGEHYVSTIYISAITKKPCLTLSYPLYNNEKEIIGVIGLDIKMEDKE